MTKALTDSLYLISTALLVPVIIALLVLLAWSLLEQGRFLREFHERRTHAAAWRRFLERMRRNKPGDSTQAEEFFRLSNYPGLLGTFADRGRSLCHHPLNLGHLMAELEIEAAGRLARMRLGVRVGPMLGLMGTLIPLGPALIGLSAGDLETMAGNLVVAFSTTVVGLLIGGVCFTMALVRRQWYSRDASDIEYVYQHLVAGQENDETTHPVWNRA